VWIRLGEYAHTPSIGVSVFAGVALGHLTFVFLSSL